MTATRRAHLLASVFFFLSGCCSLLYQVVLMRMAMSHFGVITPVLSTFLAVFMIGLGIGSFAAGRWTGKRTGWTGSQFARAYGFIEVALGLWALMVPTLYNIGENLLVHSGDFSSFQHYFSSAIVITFAILPGALLAGATLPFGMAYLHSFPDAREESFSRLYAANLFGAVVGVLLSAMILLELIGFRLTLFSGAVLNIAVGIAAWTLFPSSTGVLAPSETTVDKIKPAENLYGVLFLTGLVSMGLEILWTRAYTPYLGTTVYAFAFVLAVYLGSSALGAWLCRRYGARAQISTLLTCAAGGILFATVAVDPRLSVQGFLRVFALLPFCLSVGWLTPMIVDRLSRGNSELAGTAYAINAIGCFLGPLIITYLVLPFVGTHKGQIILGVLVTIGAALYGARRGVVIAAAGLAALLFFRGTSPEDYGGPSGPKRIMRDSTATVVACGEGFHRKLKVNGIGLTVLTPITKMMAHLPVMFHPAKPKDALMICFGMGTTFRSLLSWDLKTTAVELVPSVPKVFDFYYADAASYLNNPLGTVVIDDGRRFLKRNTQQFDIITLDPPPPVEAAGSSFLYSSEFYVLIKKHLREGGVLQQWLPPAEPAISRSVARTIIEAFPYVKVYRGLGGLGLHFIASESPLPSAPKPEDFIARMTEGAKRDLLEWNPGWELKPLVAPVTSMEVPIAEFAQEPVPLLTDDRPFNEYFLMRRRFKRFFLRYEP